MLGRRSLSSDKKRGFRVEDGGLGAEGRGWGSPCGGPSLPETGARGRSGAGGLRPCVLLGGRSACGGGCLQISGAHSPHQIPFAALCLGATLTVLSALDHAWPCLPLHLEEAAATSVFPLGLCAPAARRVPGGLIKFDLFFFFSRQSISPPPPPGPAACSPFLYSLGKSCGLPPELRVCPAACKAGAGEWGCCPSCGAVGGGHPSLLPRRSAPNLPPKSRPSPLLFASLERGAEPLREECVNFLTGGSCPRPEWTVFRRGARGAPGFVYI